MSFSAGFRTREKSHVLDDPHAPQNHHAESRLRFIGKQSHSE
ncbi:hypothetical protein BRPE64_DCDS01840 (plasmid) [Caballeronia insecticola]|uniref:Uncharacterized protein n=1 Tax=Caballeronia insecticola TaxID=758793 RepID=R4WZG6_9BURK|nr:hypothetical protein BRPE64_DCDS01840 [Caballeronia insecticola]